MRSIVLTIGAYGWNAERFFGRLAAEQVGVLCDVRRRRGVRGSEYAFANSRRLQARLEEIGVAYVHRLDLAPTPETRRHQATEDARLGVAKRVRAGLSADFVKAYEQECLARFDARAFLDELAPAGPICLFCVERDPAACHRSLIAEHLRPDGAEVRHLLP